MNNAFKAFLALLLVFGLNYIIYISGTLAFFDNRIFDIFSKFNFKIPETPFKSTVVVAIDEKSLHNLGQWPWNRIITAKLAQEILRQRPAVLGFDVLFPEKDRTSLSELNDFYKNFLDLNLSINGVPSELMDNDKILAKTLSFGNTVMPIFASNIAQDKCEPKNTILANKKILENIPKAQGFLCNLDEIEQAAKSTGFINSTPDSDGILRHMNLFFNYNNKLFPSLAVAMLMQLDENLKISKNQDANKITINFLGKTINMDSSARILNFAYPESSFQVVSASDVISQKIKPDFLTGKIVLVGATAVGLPDKFIASNSEIISGVFFHAAFIENALLEKIIYKPEIYKNISLILSVLLSLVLIYLVMQQMYLYSWIMFFSVAIISFLGTQRMLEAGVYTSIGYLFVPFAFVFFNVSLFFAVINFIERKKFIEELSEAHSATIDSMTMVAESRDTETGAHIIRTKYYVKILADYLYKEGYFLEILNKRFIETLFRAAPLHDIGKVGIPDQILRKPGRLDFEEMNVMKTHSLLGKQIIENAINNYNKKNEFLTIASNIAYTHHEKWDGSGYPRGLQGREIPLEGRLMAIADVYDALVSRRCYKESFPYEVAENIILTGDGKHFDPLVIKAFFALKDDFRAIAEQYKE